MALSDQEQKWLNRLKRRLDSTARQDELLWRYFRLQQRIEHLGMAIPPEMRNFMVVANWCRTVVETIRDRQQVRWMMLPGEDLADPELRRIWDANNLTSHVGMFNTDRMIFGRAFMSVGANDEDPSLPIIRVESPRQMAAVVDPRTEKLKAAARFYQDEDNPRRMRATLYLPDVTIHCERVNGKWVQSEGESSRDEHNLGAVPVVMHLNRRLSGEWEGESQLTDIIPFVDSVARSFTNMQFAQEAHGVPSIWATGVTNGDFVDKDGKPIPMFEAYFDAIKMLSDAGAKWGQFEASDLKNFETAVNMAAKQATVVTGFPSRYFGITTSNPPAEGAIRADESTLIRSVENQNTEVGTTLGWVGGLALRFATGEWVPGNQVKVEWFDPATPTVAQRADAIAKLATGDNPILSREGAWDELGWSETRKNKERAYFEAQAADDLVNRLLRPPPAPEPAPEPEPSPQPA